MKGDKWSESDALLMIAVAFTLRVGSGWSAVGQRGYRCHLFPNSPVLVHQQHGVEARAQEKVGGFPVPLTLEYKDVAFLDGGQVEGDRGDAILEVLGAGRGGGGSWGERERAREGETGRKGRRGGGGLQAKGGRALKRLTPFPSNTHDEE